MALQGPIVVIADKKDAELVAALGADGAFPIVEATWRDGADAIARIEPAAVVTTDPEHPSEHAVSVRAAIAAAGTPYLPVIVRVADAVAPSLADALPITRRAPPARVAVRLASALRVRTLHATALRRADALKDECDDLPVLPTTDPIEDATVIVTGRGRGYPALSTAVGERVGLIGALSVETAAKYLNARDVDGIVIGEGFNPRTVEAFLTVLSEDSRFRDLPIAVVPEIPPGVDQGLLPNLEHIGGEPGAIVDRILPLVRQHALEARLQRQLGALETKGLIDPQTGLFTVAAFLRELNRAVDEARVRGNALTLARFTFPPTVGRRANMDAARLVSRLVRSADFACRASDGSILLAFAETALRSAHVVARRIANVLRHTMLTAEGDDGKPVRVDPTITLASLKTNDTVESLLARVSEPVAVAARSRHAYVSCSSHRSRPMPDTSEPLTIDVVSDVVCPWCFIGKRRLEKAIASRPDLPVTVRFHPYFLNDWVPREGISRTDYLTTKFGSPERYNQNVPRVVAAAASEGLTYAPDKIQRQPNTLDCHRLILWADQQNGNGPRMKQRLMSLYFSEGADLTDREVLVQAAVDCGLDGGRVRELLAGDTDVDTVTRAAKSAKAAGIDGVPMFIFDGALAVSGAQSPEYLVSAMERSIAEREKRGAQAAE